MEVELDDGEYLLRDGTGWFTVGRFSVRIYSDSLGIECLAFPLGREADIRLTECVAYAEDLPTSEVVSLKAFKARRQSASVAP
jgi:hypothetical protein